MGLCNEVIFMEIISDEDFMKETTIGDALCAFCKILRNYPDGTLLDIYMIDEARRDFVRELGAEILA